MRSTSLHTVRSYLKSGVLVIFTLFLADASAQISHGGRPLPLSAGIGARSVGPSLDFFVEMPSFDEQAAVRRARQGNSQLKSLEFAHKFDVHLRPDNSGIVFT